MLSDRSYLGKFFRQYPLIRNLKNHVPIEQALARCMILVGIKPYKDDKGKTVFMSEIEKSVMIDFITRTYPSHVAPEIIKAFEMAVKREFRETDHDKLLNHYGTFSVEYVSRIMAVYNEQIRNETAAKELNVKPLYQEPMFNLYASYELGLFIKYDNLLKDGAFDWTVDDGRLYYDSLKELGVIQDTKEERVAFGMKARETTPRKKPKHLRDKAESDEDYNIRLKKVAKFLAFQSWIQEQAFEEVDLRSLISPMMKIK